MKEVRSECRWVAGTVEKITGHGIIIRQGLTLARPKVIRRPGGWPNRTGIHFSILLRALSTFLLQEMEFEDVWRLWPFPFQLSVRTSQHCAVASWSSRWTRESISSRLVLLNPFTIILVLTSHRVSLIRLFDRDTYNLTASILKSKVWLSLRMTDCPAGLLLQFNDNRYSILRA